MTEPDSFLENKSLLYRAEIRIYILYIQAYAKPIWTNNKQLDKKGKKLYACA